jgi:hypothetical protein
MLEGQYSIYARDMVNNETRNTFKVDYGISAEFQQPLDPQTRSASMISRAHWGVKWARLYDVGPHGVDPFTAAATSLSDGGASLEQIPYVTSFPGGGQTNTAYTLHNIQNGSYAVIAEDELGLTTSLHANSMIQVGSSVDTFGVTQTYMQAFSVSPPFFTPAGVVTLKLPDQTKIPFTMSLDGVSETGTTAVWLTASSKGTLPPSHFTFPQGSDLSFNMKSSAVSSGGAAISIGYDARGLTADQEAGIRLLQSQPGGTVDATLSVDTGAHVVSGHVTTLDPVTVAVPVPSSPLVTTSTGLINGQPELSVTSYRADAALVVTSATETAAGFSQLKAQAGLVPVGGAYALIPTGVFFRPRANAIGRADPAVLSALGVPASSLGIYLSTDGFKTIYPLTHPSANVSSAAAAGEIASTDLSTTTYIALLGKPMTPVTTLTAQGGSRIIQNKTVVSAGTALQLFVSSTAFSVASSFLQIDQQVSTTPLQSFM